MAAAVTVAASVPTAIGPKRSVGPWPAERQNTTSPSTSENTGSTALATPPLAILATRAHADLSSAASVITQARVVFRSSRPSHSGGAFISAISDAVESVSPSSPRGPASTLPSSPITSPNALTTATAATVSPRPPRAAAAALRDPRGGGGARRVARLGAGKRSGTSIGQVIVHSGGDDRHEAGTR